VAKRRIQPNPSVALETVTLRLPVHLVRAVDRYAKYLGGSSDRTYVIAQAIEIALAQDTDALKTSALRGRRRVARRCSHERVAMETDLLNTLNPGGARTAPPAPSRNTRVFTAALSVIYVRPSSPLRP
jgi:hypothetical protein